MSDPTSAQEQQAADAMLDAQIDAHLHEKYEQRMRDEAVMREPPDDFHIFTERFESVCEIGHDSWNLRPGSWYVVTTDGEIFLYATEYEAIIKCSDLGMVQRQGYAKHLARGADEAHR